MTTLNPLQFLVIALAGLINRQQQQVIGYQKEETRVLRELLGPKRQRFTDHQRVRLATKAKALGRKALAELDCIVTPDTLMRWYRNLIARKYDGSKKRGSGRPSKPKAIKELIFRMARENLTWGYTRIQGALMNVGFDISRITVRRIMLDNGLDPAHIRKKGMSWKRFLEIHWE